jgi:hypothetical protein
VLLPEEGTGMLRPQQGDAPSNQGEWLQASRGGPQLSPPANRRQPLGVGGGEGNSRVLTSEQGSL